MSRFNVYCPFEYKSRKIRVLQQNYGSSVLLLLYVEKRVKYYDRDDGYKKKCAKRHRRETITTDGENQLFFRNESFIIIEKRLARNFRNLYLALFETLAGSAALGVLQYLFEYKCAF